MKKTTKKRPYGQKNARYKMEAPRVVKRAPAKKRTPKQLLKSATDRVRELTTELVDFKRKAGTRLAEEGELVTRVRELNTEIAKLSGENRKLKDEMGTGPTAQVFKRLLEEAELQGAATRRRRDVLIDALANVIENAGLASETIVAPRGMTAPP